MKTHLHTSPSIVVKMNENDKLVLTFLAIHNLAPAYITDLISAYEPGRQLRSASRLLLTLPRHNLERFGRRGYSVNAPHLWNDLPDNLRLIDSVTLFKGHLKTHLFKAAFSHYFKQVLGFVCLPNSDANLVLLVFLFYLYIIVYY